MGPKRPVLSPFDLLASIANAVEAGNLEHWLHDASATLGAKKVDLVLARAAKKRGRDPKAADAFESPVGVEAALSAIGVPPSSRDMARELLPAAARGLSDALERDRLLAIERIRNRVFSEACGRAGVGLVVVRWDGRIESTNPAADAILGQRDGLSTSRGMLDAPREVLDGITALCSRPDAERVVLSLVRASSRLPYLVAIERAKVDRTPVLPMEPRVIMLVDDPSIETRVCLDSLRRIHGLTKAEARTAVDLIAGRTLDEIACGRGVAIGTVRTHVKRLMAKTRTSRQADIVRLFVRPGPQLILGQGLC